MANLDGIKVSSKNAFLGSPKSPMFKCPKCGCVYWSPMDVASISDPDVNTFLCNECGTELETVLKQMAFYRFRTTETSVHT